MRIDRQYRKDCKTRRRRMTTGRSHPLVYTGAVSLPQRFTLIVDLHVGHLRTDLKNSSRPLVAKDLREDAPRQQAFSRCEVGVAKSARNDPARVRWASA